MLAHGSPEFAGFGGPAHVHLCGCSMGLWGLVSHAVLPSVASLQWSFVVPSGDPEKEGRHLCRLSFTAMPASAHVSGKVAKQPKRLVVTASAPNHTVRPRLR